MELRTVFCQRSTEISPRYEQANIAEIEFGACKETRSVFFLSFL